MKKLYKNIFLFLLGIIFFTACSKDTEDIPELNSLSQNTNEVNQETIKLIANNFVKNTNLTTKGVNSSKKIKTIIEHKTAKNNNAFYVINFEEGGFIIITADDRISPILAYSDTGRFSSDSTQIIPPIADWIENVKNNIQSTISDNKTQSKNIKLEWQALSLENFSQTKKTNLTGRIAQYPYPVGCPNLSITKGPYLMTTWGQGDGYNNLITINCSYSNYTGYKAYTGCEATAMAQVIRYFQKANTYNWNNMPNVGQYSNGTSDIQHLMLDARLSVIMKYGCSGSTAYTKSIVPALINTFHYSYANLANFDLNTVVQNLNIGKPVILTGNSTGVGHA